MSFIVSCRICREQFEPSADAFIAGTWQTCPACRTNRNGASNDEAGQGSGGRDAGAIPDGERLC